MANDIRQEIQLRIELAKTSPIEFIDHFCYTFDPRVMDPHLPFRLFDYQKDLVTELRLAIENGYDLFIEKSRDMGATYCTVATFLWFWLYIPGSNFLLGSRKEDLVDNRFGNKNADDVSNKEESLFGKLEYLMTRLVRTMYPANFDIAKHMGYMRLINPVNGNVISGESSNVNFSRGGRYKAVLLDEFAFWDNDTQAWGATADTTKCRVLLTTPGSRPNTKAKRLRFGQDGEQIKIIEIDYKQDPRKTREWEDNERQRRSSDDFAREVKRNWESSIKGRVYDEIVNAIIGDFPYNPDLPLFDSWDFGLDGTAIQFWQKNLINGKMRLVQSFHYDNKPIQYSFPLFGFPIDSTFTYSNEDLDLIAITSQFKKAVHFGDPDVAKRAYQSKMTRSTRQELKDKGIYIQTKPEANDFYTRRDKTKILLQAGVEVNDTKENRYWIECLQSAQYPDRSETSQNTKSVVLPIHNWTSHHRTATEYFAVNYYVTSSYGRQVVNQKPPDWWKVKQTPKVAPMPFAPENWNRRPRWY